MSLTIEKFIQLVRQRPLLYDVYNANYKNREKRSEAWDEIALEMGIQEGIYWSCRWKSLKDNYNKFKKSSQKGYSKYKNWPWAKYMTFCDNSHVLDKTENAMNSENSNHDMQDQTPGTSIKEEPATSIDVDDEHDVSPNDLFVEFKGFRKRTLNNAEVVNKKIRLDTKKKLDEIDCFFHSYAQAFKRLPSGMQSMLKLEIATLFSWYELQVQKDDDSRMTQPLVRPKGDVLSTAKGSWITYSPLFVPSTELGRPNTVGPFGSAVPREIPVNIAGEKNDDDDDDSPLITLKSERTEADGTPKLMTEDHKTTFTVKIERDCDDVNFTINTVTGEEDDDVVNSEEE